VRRNIELLATIHEFDTAHTPARKIFGNIVELGGQALILETGNELRVGAAVILRVVFPGQPRGDDPFARLRCSVRKVRNDPQLHYDLSIVDMDDPTRERLELYLTRPTTGWGI
jgi:hypothetical protein